MNKKQTVLGSAIVLYFIIGLEILIMISPFAGYFYAVFNPFLLEIAKYPATKWLSAFFLPHMVVPATDALRFIRIMGSVLFILGMGTFFLCAIQVYTNKFLKKGTALRLLYSYIRHPQYLGLGIAGIGLSILWPRFIVAVLWLAMILIYYFLSKDEERRMLAAHEAEYTQYMQKSGMFLPKSIEDAIVPSRQAGKVVLFGLIAIATLGGAFLLRHYTVSSLPIWSRQNVTVLPIRADDKTMLEHRMGDILHSDEIRSRLQDGEHYLVYFMPQDYIMQGLIADTGGQWKLYKQHHTISMITDWLIHPFRHLEEGHHAMHMSHVEGGSASHGNGMMRRLIFVSIKDVDVNEPSDVFSISARRIPVMMVDVDVHEVELFDLKMLPVETGWGQVPTPVF